MVIHARACACACVTTCVSSIYADSNICVRTFVRTWTFPYVYGLHKNVLRTSTVGFTRGETDLKCAFVIGVFGRASRFSSSENREMSAIILSDKAPRRFNKNVPGSDILFIFDIQPAACVLNVSTLDVRKYL